MNVKRAAVCLPTIRGPLLRFPQRDFFGHGPGAGTMTFR